MLDRTKNLAVIKSHHDNGRSQEAIAQILGVSRAYVQTMIRVLYLPYLVQQGFVDGWVRQKDVLLLERARRDGTFDEVWGRINRGEEIAGLYDPRSRAEIHHAIETTTNPTTKAALEWVLKRRENL